MLNLPESNRSPVPAATARARSLRPRWARRLRLALGASLATVLVGGLVGGLALAQAPGAAPETQVNAGLTRQVNLTPAEMVQQSESVLSRLDASRSTVRRML